MVKTYLHTKNEVSMWQGSKVIAWTDRNTGTHRLDWKHYLPAYAGGKNMLIQWELLKHTVEAVSVNVELISARQINISYIYVCLIFRIWALISQQNYNIPSLTLRHRITKYFAILPISFTSIFLGPRSICFGWHRIHDVASFCCYRSLHSTSFLPLQVITSR